MSKENRENGKSNYALTASEAEAAARKVEASINSLEQENAKLKEALFGLVGERDIAVLKVMKATIESMDDPLSNNGPALAAISCLIEVSES